MDGFGVESMTNGKPPNMVPLVDDVRHRIWEERIAADTRKRYFQRLSSRAKTTDDVLRCLLVLTSSSTVVSGLAWNPNGTTALAIGTAILAALTVIKQFGCLALELAQYSIFWGNLHRDYIELWEGLDGGQLTQEEAADRLRKLQDSAEPIDQRTASIRERRKIVKFCFDRAEAMVASKETLK